MKPTAKARRRLRFSHHGSLSKDIRHSVETRLKNGELKAIVATDSLELGIDIGELDEVFLVETPPSISKALQRIGRAGHGVGQPVEQFSIQATVLIFSTLQLLVVQ